jgi:hypothetical protein
MDNTQQNTGDQSAAGAAVATATHDPAAEKEVLKLIEESTTMQKEEKDGWIALLPQMNDAQVTELKRILATEKEKLEEIDARYKKQVKKLEKDYINNYLTKKSRQKWQKAREKEQSHLEESDEQAEELLSQL